MNNRQQIALKNPCARAWETQNEQFKRFYNWKDLPLSSIVTVNK